MPSIGDITGRIVIVDKGSPALHQFESNIKGSIKTIEIAGGRLTASLEGMLSKTAILATAGMIARTGFQFLKESAGEAIEAERAFAQLRAGVESTGGAAGKSAEELSALADELSKLTGFDDEIIAGGEAILLTFRRVRGEAFEQTMKAALDLSARFGKDIDSSVTMIAKALDMLMAGSAKGLPALSKAGVTFTDQQKQMMEQLVRTGQATEAERLFFKELELQFGGSAEAARNTMGGALRALGVAWSNLKEEVGSGGIIMTGVIEKIIYVIETMTDGIKLFQLGFTLAIKSANDILGSLEVNLRRILATILTVAAKLTSINPLASDEQKLRAEIAASKARYNVERVRNEFAERSRKLEADAYHQAGAILGILPKVQSKYSDIGAEIEKVKSKQNDWFTDLKRDLAIQTQALDLFRQGMPVEKIENLVEAAEGLGKTNLLDPLVLKAGVIKTRIDEIANAFKLADEAKKKFAELGTLDDLIQKQFDKLPAGSNDPEMQKLIAALRTRKQLTDATATAEERRLAAVREALIAGVEGEALQRIMLANADQWNMELSKTQIRFNEIYEKLSGIAEGIAFDLVSNWRRAWEENESIVDATVDTIRDSFLNVLQDIISQWLSAWFRAMAAWLARWIATQAAAKTAQAGLGASGASGAGGGIGSLFGMGQSAYSSGTSASALAGYALAAYAIYVVYRGFIEDHKRKFARVEIIDGQAQMTAWHGKKYMNGVQSAAESIVKNVIQFLDDLDITINRLGSVIIESSKAGWNVSIPGSTGKLFASMEEAISYAQVLMLKYAEFADSVSLLVRSVISSSKAISIEQLASDIAFAKGLETQNLEQAALDVQHAMDLAISQWKRAEDLFLSFYDSNLPAFAEAATSILTRLGNSLWATYNQLAGIEEDPQKAWQRNKTAYNAQRLLVLAQLKLWALEIDARIKNLQAGGLWLGGLGGITQGTLKFAAAMVQAAEILDPALQSLLDIQALITQAINETPPELTDADYPGKKGGKGGGKNRREMREDIRDEIDTLEAEARGPLHAAFDNLNNNIAAFRDRAKEAKLPAAELAHGVELLTEAFKRSVQSQARDYAGLDTELSKRLREIHDFFDEVRELGPDKTGISTDQANLLESQALAKLGADLSKAILEFAGLSDPMLAVTIRANDLRQSVLEFAEAAGWSSDQINEALHNIERGIEGQRLQGINAAMGTLLGILKQAGLYEKEALEFDRQNLLIQLQLLEAQFRFYGALTEQTQAMLDAARKFVLSSAFGGNGGNDNNDVVRVRVVDNSGWVDWDDIVDKIKSLVDDWREAVQQFANSTADLMTDEGLTNLTQDQQLAFAKSQVEMLATKAQGGDIEALQKLDAARAEYLRELRESEGAGFGFDKGWDWVMNLSADLLKNAKAAEDSLIAKELAKNIQAWSYVMDKLAKELEAAFYTNTQDLIDAIYNAINGVPGFANGGIVMKGPRLVRIAEYVPEAIVPLDRLSQMVPFDSGSVNRPASNTNTLAVRRYGFMERDSLARLSAVEASNRDIAKSLASIRDDMSVIRRSR